MEELIKIAFDGVKLRIDNIEKQIEELNKKVDFLKNKTDENTKSILDTVAVINGYTQKQDELEVYKFGE